MWLIIFIPIRDIHHRDENKKRLYIVTHTQSERSTEQQSSTFTYILTSGSGKKISLDYVIQKIVWKNSHATTWLHQLCIARFTAHVLNLWTVWIIQRLAHPRRQCQMLNKAREDTCLVICYYPSFVTQTTTVCGWLTDHQSSSHVSELPWQHWVADYRADFKQPIDRMTLIHLLFFHVFTKFSEA